VNNNLCEKITPSGALTYKKLPHYWDPKLWPMSCGELDWQRLPTELPSRPRPHQF